jgi:putative transposase
MNLTEQMISQLKKDLSGAKTYQDLMGKDGAIKKLLKNSLEQMLEAEMTEHLGYEKHSLEGNNSGNSRNGLSNKSLKTDQGEIDISIPGDRKGKFDSIVVGKYQKTIGDLESKVISMYAKGMTTRDIESHIEDIYGLELSATSISNITNTIIPMVKEWQSRPLDAVYPIVFLDAVHFKVKDDSHIVTKAAYTCLGIDLQGQKDMFGIWIGQAESSKFWMGVLTELKNRGVKDILIACVDGLKGFTEAIESVFPNTTVQKCVIHQIRNSLKYIASKDQKAFMKDLKPVYNSPTEELAVFELDNLDNKWGKKYPIVINSWRENWQYLSTYFQYPQEIRTMIYTTNAVEALHRQFRKVTKSKTLFTNDDALSKMLYLAFKDISKKWTMPVRNWAFAISHFSVIFKERIKNYI